MRQEWYGQIIDGHLGGYVPGGDPDTYYPILWRALVEERGIRSVLDVGCGDGRGAMANFEMLGCEVMGIDGIPQDNPRILHVDYTEGPSLLVGSFDMVWCCEFVEHVEGEHIQNFLADFTLAPLVLMTHAVPGQPGHHHVNCRPSDYWEGWMKTIGYDLDVPLTAICRSLAKQEPIPGPSNYFARTGMAFRRTQ